MRGVIGVDWLGEEVGEGSGGREEVRSVRYFEVGVGGGGEERDWRMALSSSSARSLRVGWGIVGGSSGGWEGSGVKAGGGGSDCSRGVSERLFSGGETMGGLRGSEELHSQPILATFVWRLCGQCLRCGGKELLLI